MSMRLLQVILFTTCLRRTHFLSLLPSFARCALERTMHNFGDRCLLSHHLLSQYQCSEQWTMWSPWSQVTDCVPTCGEGTQTRQRLRPCPDRPGTTQFDVQTFACQNDPGNWFLALKGQVVFSGCHCACS